MSKQKKLYGKTRTVPVLKTLLDFCSWIKKGNMRTFVFFHIKKMTAPSDIVKQLTGESRRKSASHYAQVSRALAELKAQGLIECLNPKEKTGRLYRLTKKGSTILKKLS